MKIAVIGGKLQGIETVLLAKLAGYESILIDRNSSAPASGLCDHFICADLVKRDKSAVEALKQADIVLPANENPHLLRSAEELCGELGKPFAFDRRAYEISSSKIASDRLIHSHEIKAPAYYPAGEFPYIAKPSGESGSSGVKKIRDFSELRTFFESCGSREDWVIQQYVEGPSYSIEVIGNPKGYRTYGITQIHMDESFDCCMVTGPCFLGEEKEKVFRDTAVRLAEMVNLNGIMDVEVIDDGRDLYVLEIDARIPSQTPLAVYYSTGVNLLEELTELTLYGQLPKEKQMKKNHVSYEHYYIVNGRLRQEGEHLLSLSSPLQLHWGIYGSDIAATNGELKEGFKGIFINIAENERVLQSKRSGMTKKMREEWYGKQN